MVPCSSSALAKAFPSTANTSISPATISYTQIVELVMSLHRPDTVRVLDLSGSQNITAGVVLVMVKVLTKLEKHASRHRRGHTGRRTFWVSWPETLPPADNSMLSMLKNRSAVPPYQAH
jgi:hypothetical protein